MVCTCGEYEEDSMLTDLIAIMYMSNCSQSVKNNKQRQQQQKQKPSRMHFTQNHILTKRDTKADLKALGVDEINK